MRRLALILCALALCGCRGQYENDNGPRGPERVSFDTAWPSVNPCGPCAK
jgi:hypothetical protein